MCVCVCVCIHVCVQTLEGRYFSAIHVAVAATEAVARSRAVQISPKSEGFFKSQTKFEVCFTSLPLQVAWRINLPMCTKVSVRQKHLPFIYRLSRFCWTFLAVNFGRHWCRPFVVMLHAAFVPCVMALLGDSLCAFIIIIIYKSYCCWYLYWAKLGWTVSEGSESAISCARFARDKVVYPGRRSCPLYCVISGF